MGVPFCTQTEKKHKLSYKRLLLIPFSEILIGRY